MIDTDKYEGHTQGPWEAPHEILVSGLNHIGPLSNGQEEVNEVDAQLIADAPLLLEEVKRLRRGIHFALSYTEPTPHTDDPWMACREFIVKYLESLIAGIDPLSFLKEWEMIE